MTRTPTATASAATHAITLALAALMALSTIAATNALAGHQYRVAAGPQAHGNVVASGAHLVVLGQLVAQF